MRGLRGLDVAIVLGFAAVLAACAGRKDAAPPDTARWSGWYVSDTLLAGARPRVVRLAVHFDTTADVTIDFVGAGTTHHPGRWTAAGDELTMQPTRGDGTPNELPFRWRLEKDRLIPLAWDRNIYGGTGVTLTKLVLPAQPADSTAGARR
jgi:hypothetical protein